MKKPKANDWPPSSDLPITYGRDGSVMSRAGDRYFDFSGTAPGAGTLGIEDERMSPQNNMIFRRIVLWWLLRKPSIISPVTITSYSYIVRKVLILCSNEGIAGDELSAHPNVYMNIVNVLPKSVAGTCFSILHELWEHSEDLEFVLLNHAALRRLHGSLPDHEARQYPYIPPRIWLYQLSRQKAFIDDFAKHRLKIEALFDHCCAVYEPVIECRLKRPGARPGPVPFSACDRRRGKWLFAGRFIDVAREFGMSDLLINWCTTDATQVNAKGIALFSHYFYLAQLVGMSHVVNFTAMRSCEVGTIRASCLVVESDPQFGEVVCVRGITTKGIDDPNALWVASPSVKPAIDMMVVVARLRTAAAVRTGYVGQDDDEAKDPFLAIRGFEPWASQRTDENMPDLRGSQDIKYCQRRIIASRLYEPQNLVIQPDDLDLARLVTPTLDPDRYRVGSTWPITLHSIRRTVTVNMCASGLVSNTSVQYQLKHSSIAQSLYYGRQHSKLRLSQTAIDNHIRTVYEGLCLQASALADPRYSSPLGMEHGKVLSDGFTALSPKQIKNGTRNGTFGIRQTLLGACTSGAPCETGGIENIIHCHTCGDAIADSTRKPLLRQIRSHVSERLGNASPGPDRETLAAQLRVLNIVLKEP